MQPKTILLAIVTAFALLNAPSVKAQDLQRIAAVVNDEVISVYDLLSRIDLVVATTGLENSSEIRREIAPRVLQNLITEQLQLQEATRLDIEVSESQMERAVASIEADSGAPPGSFFTFLDSSRLNRESALAQIRAQITWGTVVRLRLGPSVVIGPEEIDASRQRYEAGLNQPTYRIAEIFLGVPAANQEASVAIDAQNLARQLQASNVDFTAFARQFSQNATAAVGGDLGWVQAGQLAPEIAARVVTLQPGEISEPVRSVEGFHILKLLAREDPVSETGGTVEVELVQALLPVAAGAPASEDAEQLDFAREIQSTVRSCDDMRRLSEILENSMSGDLGTVRLADLPPEIRQAVTPLSIGIASAPVRTANGYHVFMVCDRKEESGPTVDEDTLREDLVARRLDLAARRYLRDLRAAAFIEIRV